MSLTLRMMKLATVIGMGLAAGSVAAQDVPTQRDAQKMLYKARKNSTEVRILRADLVPPAYQNALQQAASIQKFYEALAVSPSEGMLAKSGTQAINYHSAAAAHHSAISGCNLKKAKASEDCVVVAEFLPKGYSGPSAFSLSFNATEEFMGPYKRARKPKAFAISPSTGNWGSVAKAASDAEAQGQAIAACNAKPGGNGDCVLVSAN